MEFLAGSEKRFFEFISSIEDKDKVALLTHNDGDGVVSAAIVSKVVGKTEYIDFLYYNPDMLKPFVENLKKMKINKIIITDLSVDNELESIKELEKFANILIIDHHESRKDLNSVRTVFMRVPTEYPAAYVCYTLFSKIQKIPEWLAALGILSDKTHRYRKENAEQVFPDFNIRGKENLFDTVMNLSMALVYFKGKEKKIYDMLINSKSPEELSSLEKYRKAIEKELSSYMKDYESSKEEFKDLVIYKFKPKHSITSILVNLISVKDANKTFIFIAEIDSELHVSSRRQDGKVDCVRFLQESIKGIPNSTAGGHKPAAGARVPSVYLKKFKENLIRVYSMLQ
jgi:oligoribonuclease NrnB/cAMP/cGMP phosphodiesterase (DHH superfamily)